MWQSAVETGWIKWINHDVHEACNLNVRWSLFKRLRRDSSVTATSQTQSLTCWAPLFVSPLKIFLRLWRVVWLLLSISSQTAASSSLTESGSLRHQWVFFSTPYSRCAAFVCGGNTQQTSACFQQQRSADSLPEAVWTTVTGSCWRKDSGSKHQTHNQCAEDTKSTHRESIWNRRMNLNHLHKGRRIGGKYLIVTSLTNISIKMIYY